MGRLVVVPTPIGNLEDITLRALRELREAPIVLAEDTRHTRKLFSHYHITSRLHSYHQHNRRSRHEQILAALDRGDVALVSDAGTPGISDPGAELIQFLVHAGIEIDVLPGPSAATTAAVLAAFPASGFLFIGFLPITTKGRRARLVEIASLTYPIVLYEAPHRLLRVFHDLEEVLGDREAMVARELTKIHQEVIRGTICTLRAHFESKSPRGEITLVVSGHKEDRVDRTDEARYELAARRAKGELRTTAVEAVAGTYGLSRNEAYRLWIDAIGMHED